MMRHVSGHLERRVLDSSSVFFYHQKKSEIEVFLAKRKANLRSFPGLWSGIGGKVSTDDKQFVNNSTSDVTLDLLKACAFREVLEEVGLVLLSQKVEQMAPQEEISLTNLSYEKDQYDWSGLVPAGLKETPEFTITNPIFKAQYFLYQLPDSIQINIQPQHKEFDEGSWKTPREWVEEFENQEIRIPPPVLSLLRTFLPNNPPSEAAKLSELRNKKPIGLQTQVEIHPGVFVVPVKSETILPATTTNSFLLGDSEHRYLVDPGSHLEEENKRLIQVIDELAGKNNLKGILLTHHHRDHWKGIPFLSEEFNVPVMAHEKTKELLQNQLTVDMVIKDKDILDLGFDSKNREWKLEVIFTGGHSRDHITFLDKRFNALFAGDMVAGVGTVLVEDMGEYMNSLDLLLSKNIGVLLPGHGMTHYDGQKLLQQYKTHRLERLKLILNAFTKYDNKATINELTKVAYSDVAEEYHEAAKRQVATNLKYLEEKKEVKKEGNKFIKI